MKLIFKDGKLVTKGKTLFEILECQDSNTVRTGVVRFGDTNIYLGLNGQYKLEEEIAPYSGRRKNDYFIDMTSDFDGQQ